MTELTVLRNDEKKQTFSLSPRNFEEAMQYAKLIADSDLAPKDFRGKPSNVLVAIQMGAELGLQPMQAIQNIAVIQGRPSIWGDLALALVKVHPEFDSIDEVVENGIATCTIKRKNQPAQTRTFTREDAKKAGLLGKAGPWQQYESRMLQLRARGFCIRDVFPDALRGLHITEELQDLPEAQYTVVETKTAEDANKRLGYSRDESMFQQGIEQILHEISTAESMQRLRKLFEVVIKSKAYDENTKSSFVQAKDKRKNELETAISEVAKEAQETIENQSNDDWLKDNAAEPINNEQTIVA